MNYQQLLACAIFGSTLFFGCKGPEGPTGPPGGGLESLTDPGVIPKVINTYPEPGTSGPYENFSTTLSVRFNKIMDPTLLRRAFTLSSPAGNLKADTTRIGGTADVFTLYVASVDPNVPIRWMIGTAYTLQIDTSAKDINGNNLPFRFSMTFTPEPSFRVKSSAPGDGIINVSLGRQINVVFNNSIDTSQFSLIQIQPPLPGYWRYMKSGSTFTDSTTIVYSYTSSAMETGTSYTLLVPGTVRDLQGHSLGAPLRFTFSTIPFEVSSTSPGDGTVSWAPGSRQISVSLTDSVDAGTLAQAFHLTPDQPGLFTVGSNRQSFIYQAISDFPINTHITVTIDTSLRSVSGHRLPVPYTFSFSTAPFGVSGATPSNGSTNVSGYTQIRISFNAAIDTSSARSSFSIAPPVVGLFDFSSPVDGFSFSPIPRLLADTVYTVTISGAMRSATGSSVGSPYSFSFRTIPFKVTSTSPSDGSTGISRSVSIFCNFSMPIDTGTVRAAFHVSPDPGGTFSMQSPGSSFTFRPAHTLPAETIYIVTIDTTLRSQDGLALPSPAVFSFATGD